MRSASYECYLAQQHAPTPGKAAVCKYSSEGHCDDTPAHSSTHPAAAIGCSLQVVAKDTVMPMFINAFIMLLLLRKIMELIIRTDRSCGDCVFDGTALVVFKSWVNASLLASAPLSIFCLPLFSLLSCHGLAFWGWGLWTDRVQCHPLSPGSVMPTFVNNNIGN